MLNLQLNSKWADANVHVVKSTSTQSVDQDVKYVSGLRVLEVVLILVGLVLVVLSVLVPILMGAMTRGGGVSAGIRSGYLRALTPFITTVSMASSFVVAAVILSFEKSKANLASVLFGILTLSVFTAEISLSIYFSLVRPLSGTAPTQLAIYALIGLILLGLGCTMFTLASIISA
jgi:uncharacterized membrane protein